MVRKPFATGMAFNDQMPDFNTVAMETLSNKKYIFIPGPFFQLYAQVCVIALQLYLQKKNETSQNQRRHGLMIPINGEPG